MTVTPVPPAVTFPSPAPAGPYAPGRLSSFNGLSANGVWSLYVVDDGPGDLGSITAGWSLTITTTASSTSAAPNDASAVHHPAIYITQLDADGTVTLIVTAGPGETCQIEASTDLETWKPLGTVQSDDGVSYFTDIAAGTRERLFYRVVTLP